MDIYTSLMVAGSIYQGVSSFLENKDQARLIEETNREIKRRLEENIDLINQHSRKRISKKGVKRASRGLASTATAQMQSIYEERLNALEHIDQMEAEAQRLIQENERKGGYLESEAFGSLVGSFITAGKEYGKRNYYKNLYKID